MSKWGRSVSLSRQKLVEGVCVCLLVSHADELSTESSFIVSAPAGQASTRERIDPRSSVSAQWAIIDKGNCGIKAWQDRWTDC